MKTIINIFVLVIATLALVRCGGGGGSETAFADTLYAPDYADGFCIYRSGGNSVLTVSNPWQGAEGVEMSLFLARDGEQAPKGFAGQVVTVPLKRVVCMSSTHVAFADELGHTDAIAAVSGARYISNATVRERYAAGEVRDIGYDSNIDYETIAALKPDLVMIYGVAGENTAMTRKFGELGIRYMYVGDYVEQSPLGKAEWLVAFGELFGAREQAEAKFAEIRDSYLQTKAAVQAAEDMISGSGQTLRSRVMLNAPYRDTWFVPGDKSYMVQLIKDAGAEYVCEGVDSDVSRPISGESAFVYASGADIWLNPGQANSLAEVTAMNPKFAAIPAVKSGRVFNCNRRSTPEGGSDFWESGAVRPDIVLQDLVDIVQPRMSAADTLHRELYYFKRLE